MIWVLVSVCFLFAFIPNRSLADLSIGITALSGRYAWPTWAVQSRLDVA